MKFLHGYQSNCLMKKLVLLATLMAQFQKVVYDNARVKAKFNGNLLKQNKVPYNHRSIVNIYFVNRLTPN